MSLSPERKKYLAEWRERNREKVNAQSRAYARRHPERIRAQHHKRDRQKLRARNTLNKAVLRGAVSKEPCEVCGNPEVQAHHSDYTKPLEVKWLCNYHHKERHREMGGIGL